jgi:hypothetical protein
VMYQTPCVSGFHRMRKYLLESPNFPCIIRSGEMLQIFDHSTYHLLHEIVLSYSRCRESSCSFDTRDGGYRNNLTAVWRCCRATAGFAGLGMNNSLNRSCKSPTNRSMPL